jgi:hypothetical protein
MVHDGPTSAADTPEAGKLGHLRDFTSPDLSSIHPASTATIWMRNSGRSGSMIVAVYRKSKSVVEVLT